MKKTLLGILTIGLFATSLAACGSDEKKEESGIHRPDRVQGEVTGDAPNMSDSMDDDKDE